MKIILAFLLLIAIPLAMACSSEQSNQQTAPLWVTAPVRTVDNGYIVYIGRGEAGSFESAQFFAEGSAIADLANECTFIPKGARIEDRYSEKRESAFVNYAKIAVQLEDCTEAQETVDPKEIVKLANQSFTEELKRYQDQIGEPAPSEQDVTDATAVASASPSSGGPGGPASSGSVWVIHQPMGYYVTQQYVVYQKQVVILNPAAPPPPNFSTNVAKATAATSAYVIRNPVVRKNPTPWSQLQNKPLSVTPHVSPPGGAGPRQFHQQQPSHHGAPLGRRRGRHRRHWYR